MLFNSWEFWAFFPIIYFLYLVIPSLRIQNLLLLAASYYFYAAWDWRFLSLIVISTVVDYICGQGIINAKSHWGRRAYLITSLTFNLGFLGFFKYYDFFVENMEELLVAIGFTPSNLWLNIVLPVGISFYTFQTMSYTIDIYRGNLRPTRNFLNFALFVSFFPQLVAGPIERAKHFLPQIERPRKLNSEQLSQGAWLIFWGLFKKIAVADNLAPIVDSIYANSMNATSAEVYLGTLAFAFQIYCDFSGYSDVARGLAKLMGFDLMLNFNQPYFALSPSDFWRRWHISLSTWLRDYLYIPLGGNRRGARRTYINLAITMFLGGLWHGASWNFIWWGVFHGLILMLYNRASDDENQPKSGFQVFHKRFIMFQLTLLGWLLFRSTGFQATDGIQTLTSFDQINQLLFSFTNGIGIDRTSLDLLCNILFFASPLLVMDYFEYKTNDHFFLQKQPLLLRSFCYALLTLFWIIYGRQGGNEFIYFQF